MTCRNRDAGADLVPRLNPFLIATSLNDIKPDAKSRRLIRRYVTKGKKLGPRARRRHALRSWFDEGEQVRKHVSSIAYRELWPADGINGPNILRVLRDFVPRMVKVMYPVDCCIDLAIEHQSWHDELASDLLYAQSVSEIAQTYFNIVRSHDQKLSKLMHLSRSLGLLRGQLTGTAAVTDSIIFTVVALVLASTDFDDPKDAITHMRGLQRMVTLRGGVTALSGKPSLRIKCCRVDLALAMRMGQRPLLFAQQSLTWKPYLAGAKDNPSQPTDTPRQPILTGTGDVRLRNIYLDLRELTKLVDLAHQTNRNVPPSLFQEVLISAQYRLHHLAYDGDGSHDDKVQETLRLAMLAFSAGLLLSGRSLHCRTLSVSGVMVEEFWTLLLDGVFDGGGDGAFLELKFWLLLLGNMSAFSRPEERSQVTREISEASRALNLETWKEARLVLKRFLWVDAMHDGPGRTIFDGATKLGADMVR